MARVKKEDNKKTKVSRKKVKKEIVQEKEEFNLDEVKEELVLYIDKEIKKGIDKEIDKTYKKIVREKTRKIFFKNIIIILLVALVLYLVYLLNTVSYFDDILKIGRKTKTQETTEIKTDVKSKSLDELKTEYSKLLDNIYISEKSNYLKDYYNGDLTKELKSYLSLNLVDFDSLEKENNYNILELNTLKDTYSKIFDEELDSINFDYNGNKISYLNKLSLYITSGVLEKNSTNIKREIIEIKEDNSKVVITTIEGLIKDNKIYNVLTNKEVGNGNDLERYKDKLNKVIYTFKNSKLISL